MTWGARGPSAAARQRGIATQLLEHGAPAVVAALQTLPDRVGGRIATAFYRHAAAEPIGLALRHARQALDAGGLAPSCWALCVLHGDPALTVSPALGPLRRTGQATASWASELVRWLATGDPQRLEAVRAGLECSARVDPGDAAAVLAWLDGPDRLPDALAARIEDRLAVAVFAAALVRCPAADLGPELRARYAQEAEWAAAGWAAASPAYAGLLERARGAQAPAPA